MVKASKDRRRTMIFNQRGRSGSGQGAVKDSTREWVAVAIRVVSRQKDKVSEIETGKPARRE